MTDQTPTSRPLPIRDDADLTHRLAAAGRQIVTLTAERDQARADRDALAQAIERADSVRIDAHDRIWRTAPDGGWQHPAYGVISQQGLDALGPNRSVLLLAIDTDDTDMGDPPADWRINLADDQAAALGSPLPRAQDALRPAGWEQQAIDVAAGALAFLLGATPAAARRLATPAVRAIIDAGLVGWGGRCPRCQQPYPRTLPPGTPDTDRLCTTCDSDGDQPAPEPAHDHTGGGLPLFDPDATLHVNSIDGPETWTGAEWNDHARAATRNGRAVPERMVLCPRSVCTTTCPVDQANTEG